MSIDASGSPRAEPSDFEKDTANSLKKRVVGLDHEMDYTASRPAILAIGTALPPYELDQPRFGQWMADAFADRPAVARLVQSLYAVSGIERRYSCIPDYGLPVAESRYAPGQNGHVWPTTGERMATYARASVPVGVAAARCALEEFAQQQGISLQQATQLITHLVVVSCTGFFAPGLDFVLTQELGLAPTVNRTLIGFMGCAAMFNGLRVASQAVEAARYGATDAFVLVVSVELCSLHSQPRSDRDALVAAALFGDGASACVVGQPTATSENYFCLEEFLSVIKPDTEGEMVWTIGDLGFQLHLSPRIPDHLVEAAPQCCEQLFGEARPAFWAIHPGGRAILDRLAEIFAVGEAEMFASREVLRRVGNVSSATLLFVLDEIRKGFVDKGGAHPVTRGIAMAFGPGLVIEMARLSFVAARVVSEASRAGHDAERVVSRP